MKKRKSKAPVAELPPESRAAEAATIAWMLCVMVVVVSELGWIVARWWSTVQPNSQTIAVLSELFFFCALLIGVMSVALVPVVLKSRRVLPPRGITFFALVVGIAPLLVAAWRLLG